jgi:trehalose-phosphatase
MEQGRGRALDSRKDRCGPLIVYIGDDMTDEDAIGALPDGVTVKIGNQLPTTAQFHVDGPEEVLTFLEWIDLQTMTE